jgi:hypothetical protein
MYWRYKYTVYIYIYLLYTYIYIFVKIKFVCLYVYIYLRTSMVYSLISLNIKTIIDGMVPAVEANKMPPVSSPTYIDTPISPSSTSKVKVIFICDKFYYYYHCHHLLIFIFCHFFYRHHSLPVSLRRSTSPAEGVA